MPIKPRSVLKFIGIMSIFALAPVSLYIMYTRTGGGPASGNELQLYKDMRFAFMTGTPTVDIAPLTSWPWVKVCALTSGLSRAQVSEIVGFEYKDYDDLHWMGRSDYWTMLFIDSSSEASWGTSTPVIPVRMPRKEMAQLSLPAGVNGVCADRDHAQLTVSRDASAPVGVSPITVSLGVR